MSDEKTSNIRQATPKQGLDTGSVEGAKGGLISGKERVAMEYSKDLSGEQGPVAMFDAVDEIAAKRVEQAMNRITFAGRGGASIFGANGSFSVVSRQGAPESGVLIDADGSAPIAFDIVRAVPQPEGGPPTFTLHLPFVRKSNKEDVDAFSVPITISDFEIDPGSWLVAKMVGPIGDFIFSPAITIEMTTGDWPDYPNAHLIDEAEPYNWTESRIPLWQFLTEANKTDSSVLLSTINDVKTYGQKLIGPSPQLVYTLAVAPENRLRTVPDLI
jgi:hypothetical protein